MVGLKQKLFIFLVVFLFIPFTLFGSQLIAVQTANSATVNFGSEPITLVVMGMSLLGLASIGRKKILKKEE